MRGLREQRSRLSRWSRRLPSRKAAACIRFVSLLSKSGTSRRRWIGKPREHGGKHETRMGDVGIDHHIPLHCGQLCCCGWRARLLMTDKLWWWLAAFFTSCVICLVLWGAATVGMALGGG